MKTATAIRIHSYGGPETVKVEDVSLPAPNSGQVVVRAHAAGVNPVDWMIRAGYMQQRIPLPLPVTLGVDFSGVIEAIGADVAGFKTGDEVYGTAAVFTGGSGSFAETLLASAETVAAKPKSVNHLEAAALPLAGISALQALTETLHVSAGRKVLIHGGAGGVGSIAIQLAKHLGAQVATTVSTDDINYAKSLGADQVIDYRNQKFEEVLRDLDAVLDTVAGETYVHSFKTLKKGGRLVSMREQPRKDLMSEFGVEAFFQFTQVTKERLAMLAGLVDKGVLKVHIDKTFPLRQAAAALQGMEKERPRGKVVLKIV